MNTLSGNILGVRGVLSGLFDSDGSKWSVTNPVPSVPAACWDKPNFKACQSWAISSPNADCQALSAKAGGWDEQSLKNCIEDKYRYRMNTYCIGSCASGTVTYPGMSTAAAAPAALTTLQLQQALNPMLSAAGYVKLTEDGKVGPKTCGAARMFMPTAVPTECSSKGFTDPTKATSTVVVKPATSTVIKPATQVTTPTSLPTNQASLMASTKWVIGSSIAVALGLVGVAVAKKKGWIKP